MTFGRQVGYVVFAHAAILVLGLVQILVLTKGLGAYLYGIWSLINTTILLIYPFALAGLNMAVVRFLAVEREKGRIREDFLSACFVVFGLGILFSVLLCLLSDYLAILVFKNVLSSSYIKLASATVLLFSMHILTMAFFRARRQIGVYTVFILIYNGLQFGLVVAALLLGLGLTGVIVAVIVSCLALDAVVLALILRELGFKFPRFSRMKEYLKWSIPLAPNAAISWIIHASDRYMVSYFLGAAQAGIYSAAYAIGDHASFVLMPLGIVLYPAIAKSYDEGSLNETRNYQRYSLKYVMMVSIPSAFGLSILAGPLLRMLTTPEFATGSVLIPFVALASVLNAFHHICVRILHLVNRTYWTLRLLGAAAIVNVGLNLVLIPSAGILGAAVATTISYGVLAVFTLTVTRKYLKFDLSTPFLVKSIFSSVVMTLCIWAIRPESAASVIVSIILGGLVYFAVLLLVRGLSRSEITFFISFARERLKRAGPGKG